MAESLSQIAFAYQANYISLSLFQEFQVEGDQLDKMLNGYVAYLKKSKKGANESVPGSVREGYGNYSISGFADTDETTL